MNKIKTFKDACVALKLDHQDLPIVSSLPAKDRKSILAYYKLVIIARALNAGWKPNWKDSSEYKYYPYFWMDRSGSGFSFNVYDYSYAYSTVGSRLCFKTYDLAQYAGKQFKKLYEEYHLLSK